MSEHKNSLIKIVGEDIQILEELIRRDQFLQIVNTEPPKEWVKQHPFVKNVKYLPIEIIEVLLTRIFQEWHVEVKETKSLLNSIAITVRLHYRDPITQKYCWQDGVGAVPAKTTKGAKPSDMSEILSDAVMTGLPAAESFAIKDAAEKIGTLFGKDLNRKETATFKAIYDTKEGRDTIAEKKNAIKEKLNEDFRR